MTNEEFNIQQEKKLKELVDFCSENEMPIIVIYDEKQSVNSGFIMNGEYQSIVRAIASAIFDIPIFRSIVRGCLRVYDERKVSDETIQDNNSGVGQ